MNKSYREGLNSLRMETSGRLAGLAGDIQSRAASQGFAPGSGTEGIIDKATQGVMGQEQQAESQLSAQNSEQQLGLLIQQLMAGLQGLPSSSPFGDVLGGLSTFANIGKGIVPFLNIGGGKSFSTSTSPGLDNQMLNGRSIS